jgi:glycosyltransferase involved in cell wall biosynthesis
MMTTEMSRRIDRHIDSMTPKPDMILQWGSLFLPYTKTPKNSFAVIIDYYIEPPRIAMQKDKPESPWSTLYDEDLYKLQKELYQKATCIFTFTQWCKKGLSREYSIDPSRIVAVGWGPLKKIVTRRPLEKDHKTILGVGNDFLVKGFDILVRAAEYLEDFSITIVGKDSKKTFKDISIPKNVQIRQVSNETLINLYLKSELFFLFSRFEAAGHVLWEAQAYGCVVVGYDAYGISEAVVNNQSGILLKTRDPILVASEIRELYRDGNTLKRMQEAAIENYKENGTWNLVSEKIIQSIRDRIEQIPQ